MKTLSMILLTIIYFLISCSGPASKPSQAGTDSSVIKKQKEVVKAEAKPAKISIDTLHNDIANVIGALKPQKYFKNIENEKYWPQYKKMVEEDWGAVAKTKIQPIKKWTDSLKVSKGDSATTLFYPFAGADFLYANSFFPDCRNYILVGLEPAGHLKNADTAKQFSQNYLFKIEKSLYFSNKLGFFRTKSMYTELNQSDLDGTVHLLTFYIKRCGYQISSVNYISLDTAGNVVNEAQSKSAKPTAVKIDFCDDSLKNLQSVYYFSMNLSDSFLSKDSRFLKFSQKAGAKFTFLKAASYLMHLAEFKIIRDFILNNSEIVLQDDSGIPYKFFSGNVWDTKLFGTYSKTISLFRNKYQADLKEAISKSPDKGKIPFRIGYNLNHNEVNLQLSKKKK